MTSEHVPSVLMGPAPLMVQGSQGESQGHYLLGLKILNSLVSEMNQPTPGRTLTQHRKIAVSFRDQVGARTATELDPAEGAPCVIQCKKDPAFVKTRRINTLKYHVVAQ